MALANLRVLFCVLKILGAFVFADTKLVVVPRPTFLLSKLEIVHHLPSESFLYSSASHAYVHSDCQAIHTMGRLSNVTDTFTIIATNREWVISHKKSLAIVPVASK